MGCCKSRESKSTIMNKTKNIEAQAVSLNASSNNTESLTNQPNNNPNNQQSLLHTADSPDYLSTGYTLAQQLINNAINDDEINNNNNTPDNTLISSNIKCQTPPIIKTLFGNTDHNSSDDNNIPDDSDTDEIKTIQNNIHPTPMGGNVYLGYADNDRPLLFNNLNNNNDSESKSNNDNDNILASSNSSNSNNSNISNSSDSDDENNDWIPQKPMNNNPQLLMGFMDENETINFNNNIGNANVVNNNQSVNDIMKEMSQSRAQLNLQKIGLEMSVENLKKEQEKLEEEKLLINQEKEKLLKMREEMRNNNNDENIQMIEQDKLLLALNSNFSNKSNSSVNDNIPTPQYINFNSGERINVESMLLFAASSERSNNPFTSSNMSLGSAKMADIVLNSSNTNLKLQKSNSSFTNSFIFNNNNVAATPRNVTDFAMLSRWMITTFNLFIEYFPYQNIIEQIFLFCNININDEIFKHCNLNFEFPNINQLQSQYNYYDYPEIYVENVSSIDKNQPSLVLMIGAPGSGKSSYANYRYGRLNVIAADDYFDINYNGKFIGELVSEAHNYCLEQCLIRLKKRETVVISNTHSTFWQLYDKIIPVLFDESIAHKIVFIIMPETNPNTLVRRCIHSCTKPKIIKYLQNIKYMKSIGINTDNILIYGNKNKNKSKTNIFEYGLWIEPESYSNLQDWYQHYANCNLFINGMFGDGRISPIVSEKWQIFKKNMKLNNIYVSKFDVSNDPFVDLEIKIIGYSNHKICQMVTIEIINKSLDLNNNKYKCFWEMFANNINISMMGCILTMKKNIPFENAKLLFDYNQLCYINDGPIIKCKLATKRYIKNYFKYFKPPQPINNIINKKKKVNNINKNHKNVFFSLDDIKTSDQCDLFNKNKKTNNLIDTQSFGSKLIENNTLNPNAEEFSLNGNKLNANAKEFKIKNNNSNNNNNNDTLNVNAMEFKPMPMPKVQPQPQPQMQPIPLPKMQPIPQPQIQPIPQPQMQFIPAQMIQTQMFLLQQPTHIPVNMNNKLNVDAQEFKMGIKNDNGSLNIAANEFKPSKFGAINNNGNILQQHVPFVSMNKQPINNIIFPQQIQQVPLVQQQQQQIQNDAALLDVTAPSFTPSDAINTSSGVMNDDSNIQ